MQVTTQKTVDGLTAAMADDYSRRILLSLIAEPKSVEELSRENGIPTSTCYRRIHEMQESGILVVQRIVITKEGKKYELYRSAFRGVSIRLENGGVTMDATLNEDVADKLYNTWSSLRWSGSSV